jgi:hypothetical protein
MEELESNSELLKQGPPAVILMMMMVVVVAVGVLSNEME